MRLNLSRSTSRYYARCQLLPDVSIALLVRPRSSNLTYTRYSSFHVTRSVPLGEDPRRQPEDQISGIGSARAGRSIDDDVLIFARAFLESSPTCGCQVPSCFYVAQRKGEPVCRGLVHVQRAYLKES